MCHVIPPCATTTMMNTNCFGLFAKLSDTESETEAVKM